MTTFPLIPKENPMHYKTIVLELLEQYPELHEQLRSQRMLLPALEFYAKSLKANHETQKALLSQARPGSNESQIASEALELALEELENSLATASPPYASEAISLDEAMAFLRRHTPPA
jgi:hypothetical protein